MEEAPTPLPTRSAWESAITMSRIPSDVMLNILARVPAKSLIRFRSVCKDWYSMITSPNFISTHLQLNPFKSNGYILLPSQYLNPYPPVNVVCQSFFSTMFSLELPFKFNSSYGRMGHGFLVGSSHGLLCFTHSRCNEHFGRALCLWNPSIRKFKSLIDTSLDRTLLDDLANRVSLGFGFDVKSNDYKIVRIVFWRSENKAVPEAEIYSLNKDSWRRVKFPLDYIRAVIGVSSSSCPLVNGSLHWVVFGEEEHLAAVVLSFCFDDEEFRLITLPGNYTEEEAIVVEEHPLALEGSFALVVLCEADGEMDGVILEICLWVMKKYGAVESWSKRIVPCEYVICCCGCTKDGKLLIDKYGDGLILVDPETLETKILGISDVESVVTLMDTLDLLE